jgi:hypothetical protein
MGWRFRRSIGILPGLRMNVGKSGLSLSAGIRGLRYTVSERGSRTTVGVPGSGLSYSTFRPWAKTPGSSLKNSIIAVAIGIAIVAALAFVANAI